MLALVEVFFTPLQSVVTLVTLSLLSSSRESSLPTFSLSLACSFSLSSFSHARLPFARVLSLLFLSLSFSSQRRVLPFYLLGHVSRGVSNATAPPLPQAVTPHLIVDAPCLACPAASRARVQVQRIHPARCAHAAHLHVPNPRS